MTSCLTRDVNYVSLFSSLWLSATIETKTSLVASLDVEATLVPNCWKFVAMLETSCLAAIWVMSMHCTSSNTSYSHRQQRKLHLIRLRYPLSINRHKFWMEMKMYREQHVWSMSLKDSEATWENTIFCIYFLAKSFQFCANCHWGLWFNLLSKLIDE